MSNNRILKRSLFILIALTSLGAIMIIIKNDRFTLFNSDHQYAPLPKKPAPLSPENMLTTDWDTMGQLIVDKSDKSKITVPTHLADLVKSRIKVVGYIIPLEPDLKHLSEFIISPSALYMAHAKRPGPSMVMKVKMKKPISLENEYQPIYVVGTVSTSYFKKAGLEGVWQMEGETFLPYDYPELEETLSPEKKAETTKPDNKPTTAGEAATAPIVHSPEQGSASGADKIITDHN